MQPSLTDPSAGFRDGARRSQQPPDHRLSHREMRPTRNKIRNKRPDVMRFNEIGQQLRAYRLESGLRAEEIAARLGVSRAALYRYEKGDVIKLDTVNRLAELLNISPLSLLGIGVEYYSRAIGYLERLRQLEETADQILQVSDPICYLVTSDAYDAALGAVYGELVDQAGSDRAAVRASTEQVLGTMAARKRMYNMRKPSIISLVPLAAMREFLRKGVAGAVPLSDPVRELCRQAARTEATAIADYLEAEPMALQFGLLTGTEPSGRFVILRSRDRVSLAINPFRADTHPNMPHGVAMVTGSDEAIAAHQRTAEAIWRDALKGPAAAAEIRDLLAEASVAPDGSTALA
jgi:transcriptional regulator with XRE-family HTH domain